MTTRTFFKYSVLTAGLVLASTLPALAQAPGGGAGARGSMGVLTQEQRTKVREVTQPELAPLQEKLLEAQKDLAKAALAENATEETVKAKAEALSKIQCQIAVARFKGVKAIASTLTAEQKAQLNEARDNGYLALFGTFGGGGGGRGARGGGGGGGAGQRNN